MKKILLAFLLGLNLAIISGCGDAKKDAAPAPAAGGDAKPAEPATK
jgi:hypothetical protein